jgi:hypothetical protein
VGIVPAEVIIAARDGVAAQGMSKGRSSRAAGEDQGARGSRAARVGLGFLPSLTPLALAYALADGGRSRRGSVQLA